MTAVDIQSDVDRIQPVWNIRIGYVEILVIKCGDPVGHLSGLRRNLLPDHDITITDRFDQYAMVWAVGTYVPNQRISRAQNAYR